MNDLLKTQQQLYKVMNQLENWKMSGYDTPMLTYHEQMEEYVVRIEMLKMKLKEEMK